MTMKEIKTVKAMFPDKWLEVLCVVAATSSAPKGWEKITTEELARRVDNYETN